MPDVIGLPVFGFSSKKLKCGCERTKTVYEFATVTELSVKPGCQKHDPPPMPAGLRFSILKRDNFACQYCGRRSPEVELHVDHVTPVARGGSSETDNLITACADCNMGKGDR